MSNTRDLNLDGLTIAELAKLAHDKAGSNPLPENSAEAFAIELNRVVNLSPTELLREIGDSV